MAKWVSLLLLGVPVYINPGQDISLLSHLQRCEIIARAASDDNWLYTLSESKRRDIRQAARRLPKASPNALLAGILAIVNHETALAAENGRYNEWEQYEPEIVEHDRQPRPFMAALRLAYFGGADPIVWTCGEVKPHELRLKRAIVSLGGQDIKLQEYWPVPSRRFGYPSLEVYSLEPLDG